MKNPVIISTVVSRDQAGKKVPTGNNIFIQGGNVDIDDITSKVMLEVAKEFLSKAKDDTANGMINFLAGIKIAGSLISALQKSEGDEKPDDESVMTSARVIREIEESLKTLEDKYLRKDQDDRTPFNIGVGGINVEKDANIAGKSSVGDLLTAKKGIQLGSSFIPGILTGSGGFFDEYGNGEIESLIVRRFMEVPELRFNRVEVKLGDKWNAPGAGLIEAVEPDYNTDGSIANTGTVFLKLEEGEYGAVAVGDICMGIFHSENSSDNSLVDLDDSRGNFEFAGFYTCYFTITEITGNRNRQFKYQLRPVSDRWSHTFHPSASMSFVCYGSFTRNDRQTSVYTTRTYTRLLKNQNTWEIGSNNIAMQYGDLSNMNIHGLDMAGYSVYLNNIYMTGTLKQVKPDGTPVNVANDRGDWVNGNIYSYYDRVSHSGSLWLCVNEKGTNTEPTKKNTDWLLQVASGSSLSAEGHFSSSNTPYQPNSVVEFSDRVWINTEVTSNAPFGIWTDNQGNRLMFSDGGFAICDEKKDEAWQILIDISGFTDGKDGAGLIVQYSADKVNWHDVFNQNDIYMRQKVGESGAWSDPMRIVGEDGQAQEGIYTDFQFAVNTSLSVAPTSGWQDAPPTVGTGQFLWMRVRVVNPNDGTATSWETTRIGGEKGKDGVGINSVTTSYGVSANPSTMPTSWSSSVPTAAEGQCLWVRTITDYTDESKQDTVTYSYSFQGKSGAAGSSVKVSSIKYQAGSSSTTAPTGTWSSSVVNVTEGQYLWTRTEFSDGSVAYGVAKQGKDGEGMSLVGSYKTGMTIPYLGVIKMGASTFSAKKETTNPPMWCWTDNQGNRFTFKDGGYALTGEVNSADYQEVASDGKNGMNGENGKDGANGKDGKDGVNGKDGKDGEPGKQGIQGCIVRDSEWMVGVEYRNDEALTSGTRFIDVVLVRNESTATGWMAFKCLKTHTSSTSITTSNKTYWEEFGANVTAIFTSLIIAKNAKITFLQGNQLLVQKDDGKVTAGFSGSEEGDKVRIWAGSETPDDAPFSVTEEGVTTASKFRTAKNGVRLEAENGVINIFGNFARNIEFGVNEEGLAVMRYYDNDGTLLYDLGPTGIKTVERASDTWATVRLTFVGDEEQDVFSVDYFGKVKNPLKDTGTDRYQFHSGYIGGAYNDAENNRKYFTEKLVSITKYIPNGWYVKTFLKEPTAIDRLMYAPTQGETPPGISDYNPDFDSSKPVYTTMVMHIVSGEVIESINVYYNL